MLPRGHFLLALLLCSDHALAAEPLKAGYALQVLLGLAGVLVLIGIAGWAAKRMQVWKINSQGNIQIVEALALGAREKLVLVELDGQRVLIGISPGRMQALRSYATPAGAGSFDTALADCQDVAQSVSAG